jgi:hypothetical protein
MAGKSSAPSAPDLSPYYDQIKSNNTTGINAAQNSVSAVDAANTANQPYVQNVQQTGLQGATGSTNAANAAMGIGTTAANTYSNLYNPATAQSVYDAMGSYDLSPVQQQQLADAMKSGDSATVSRLTNAASEGAAQRAMGTANASAQNSATAANQNLTRAGMDPNSLAAHQAEIEAQNAATATGSMNAARTGAVNQGIALRQGVANAAPSMAGLANSSYATGGNLYSNATGNANTAANAIYPGLNAKVGANTGVTNAALGGNNGIAAMGGLQNQQYQIASNNTNAANAATSAGWGGLGSAAGMIGGSSVKGGGSLIGNYLGGIGGAAGAGAAGASGFLGGASGADMAYVGAIA